MNEGAENQSERLLAFGQNLGEELHCVVRDLRLDAQFVLVETTSVAG